MSKFDYTLPSGSRFTLEAPNDTTQTQADYIFYSQVAAGALVDFKPGQKVSGVSSEIAKFTLSRLDRGTAGVEDTVILAIVNGLPSINNLPAVNGIPSLIDTPLVNPVTPANIANIQSTGFTAPAIGPLSNTQVEALMAQVANTVDQPSTTATDQKGIGQYGFSCQNLEIAGYVKPGTWQQFIKNGPSTLVEVLNAPGTWTGLNGIYSLDAFLKSSSAQNDAQSRLMANGYNSLQAAGVIQTPSAQIVSTVEGTVYTGTDVALTTATAAVTNQVNEQVAALITNASQYGTDLTAQWARDLPPVSGLTSNLTSIGNQAVKIPGLGSLTSGISANLSTVKTAMDTLGKASQFASTAASALNKGLSGLSGASLSNLSLSNLNVGALTGKLGSSAQALAGRLQGQLSAQATALLGQAQAQANAIIAQAQGQLGSLLAQGNGLVSSVQKAAGFANTVNRATVDTAFTKILGSSKISVPNFGTPNSASIAAALDINKAKSVLSGLQGQATAIAGQANAVAGQVAGQATALASQVQGQASNLLATARGSVNQII